jgi:hypothetical protein
MYPGSSSTPASTASDLGSHCHTSPAHWAGLDVTPASTLIVTAASI